MMCSGSVYFQFVQIPHKETPFLSCTIRVQSGRNRKTSSQDAMQAMKTAHLRQKPGGAALLKKFALFTGHVQLIFFYKKDSYGLNLSVSLRSPAPLVGEPLAFRCVCIVTQ